MGAGLIGARHAGHVAASPEAVLSAVVDPSEAGREAAARHGVAWFASLTEMLVADRPDGVIVATPNQVHVRNGLECVAAGLPALIEKPLADDLAGGLRLVEAAEAAGVPLLTGHHRRHNPLMRKAKALIEAGAIGRPLVANAMFWLCKPDDYFDVPWRREAGAGPVYLNLIHDVDCLRFLLGDIVAVQAIESNAVRGFAVEETAAILLEFASGALGTASVCDATVAPWSWEMTAGENPAYPQEREHCYQIGGTEGSLALPSLDLRRNPGARSWWEPFDLSRPGVRLEDPLAAQVRHFAAVIRGEESPLVSGREGLRTLHVIDAVKRSAAIGQRVVI
nr:Gfo/Idh/MocA family oxidoreductase [Rubellimicrobium aerolatum]